MSALIALGLSVVLGPVVLAGLRRLHALDSPCARSSHETPTPRGGGLAPAVAAVVALAVSSQVAGDVLVAVVAGSALYGAIGLVEDLRGVPALPRLAAQLGAALVVLPWLLADLGGPWGWKLVFAAGVVLWLASYVNAFNFMDGINGISVAQVVVAGVAWWALGRWQGVDDLATAGLVVALAALGFLPFNFPRAAMFLGDVGSYFLGAGLAVLAVVGLRAGIAFEAMFAPLALYLADTAATLVRRVRRRETWHEPHCDHAYQRLHHHLGWSHTRTTTVVALLMAACAALGAVAETSSLAGRLVADVALAGVLAGYLALPRLLAADRHQARAGSPERVLA